MPKDRLAELKVRSGSKADDVKTESDDESEEVRLFVGAENDVIVQLQVEVDAIRRDINIIERSLKLLKQKQDDAASYKGTSDERNKLELTEITDNINKIARCLRRKLKAMGAKIEQDGNNPLGNSEEHRIRKIQHMTQTKKFSEVMQTYLELQEIYRDKCKTLLTRQILIVDPSRRSEEIEKMLEDNDMAVFIEDILVEGVRAKQDLDDAQALNAHLKKIEQGIVEVHDLFQELGGLVSQQGEVIDRIETHVTEVREATKLGVKQLAEAKDKKDKARRCRNICIAVVVVVVIVTVAILLGVYAG